MNPSATPVTYRAQKTATAAEPTRGRGFRYDTSDEIDTPFGYGGSEIGPGRAGDTREGDCGSRDSYASRVDCRDSQIPTA
jgi:hypothetical protein